jgi:8-oxo-dGTP pyrophosphatase MutT (NUDIX family)
MPLTLRPPRVRKWTRARVDTFGRYGVFDVERAAMVDPDGNPSARDIFTFRCNPWCNVVAITDADEVVMIWQYRHGTDALSLEIPGGVVDPGESPIDAARRELREETGYGAPTFEPLITVHPNPALQGNEHHSFLARGARLEGATAFDDNEECEVALVPARDIAALLDEGHVTHALVVVALERYLRRR